MTTPDSLVASLGISVTHSHVTVAGYDSAGRFDEGASTIVNDTIKAIVSQPRERQLPPRLQGQEMLRITIPSSTDVKADRAGRPDRFTINGRLWEVTEVRDDRHGLVGVRKKTVLLTPLADPAGTP